jgi:Reverse transcriptase-like
VNYVLQLLFMTSKNIAKYEALLLGLRFAKGVVARRVVAYSDSQFAVNQILGVYEAKDGKVKKYLEELQRMCTEFDKAEILHIPRTQNQKADALSKLAAEGDLDKDRPVVVLEIPKPSVDVEYVEQYQITNGEEWYAPIWDFLTRGYLPQEPAQIRSIRRQAVRYVESNGVLFHRGFVGP